MLVGNQKVEEVIDSLFQQPDISFIHVRNAEAKCFISRIERAVVEEFATV